MDGPGSLAPAAEETRLGRVLQARDRVLELVATGSPLVDVLTALTRANEELLPGLLCSVLLLDPVSRRLHHGAAPSLPDFYSVAIDGLEIGPGRGSCGTAAHTGQRVIVEDILTHPYWAAYASLATAAGLRACWSEPIFSSQHDVLGTFAMYYREPRSPTAFELALIRTSAHVAGVAIERARTDAELARHRRGLEAEVQRRTAELEQANRELRQALRDVKALRGLLPICASCKRVRDDQGYWSQIEAYIAAHSEAVVMSGACRECAGSLYPPSPRGSSPPGR